MTDEQRPAPATEALPVCEWCGRYLRSHMDAYYYGFSATRSDAVNRILCSVASAGKAYHHTEDWNDGGYVEKIQDAAITCAAEIDQQRETIAALQARADKAEADAQSAREGLEKYQVSASKRNLEKIAEIVRLDSQLAQARAEVETLRHALKRLSCHPCRYQGVGGWKKCHGKPDEMCDMCCARAALAASKPGSPT